MTKVLFQIKIYNFKNINKNNIYLTETFNFFAPLLKFIR